VRLEKKRCVCVGANRVGLTAEKKTEIFLFFFIQDLSLLKRTAAVVVSERATENHLAETPSAAVSKMYELSTYYLHVGYPSDNTLWSRERNII